MKRIKIVALLALLLLQLVLLMGSLVPRLTIQLDLSADHDNEPYSYSAAVVIRNPGPLPVYDLHFTCDAEHIRMSWQGVDVNVSGGRLQSVTGNVPVLHSTQTTTLMCRATSTPPEAFTNVDFSAEVSYGFPFWPFKEWTSKSHFGVGRTKRPEWPEALVEWRVNARPAPQAETGRDSP